MQRTSPLDAGFLDLEDEDRHASLAIASIAVFEGPTPSHDQFLAAIAGRLPLVPRYRHKARQLPLDLGRPVWVDDPHFEPSTLRLTAAALRDLAVSPVEQLRALRGALDAPRQALRRTAATARGLAALAGALVPTSASSLSGPIGRPRRYRWARASLADIKAIRSQLGGTRNDVALAAITGAFRALLLARGERPGPHAIRSLVPVSVRPPGQEGSYDNRFSLLLASLPVDIADPVERLAAVSAHLAARKASREAEAGATMTSIAGYEPFPLVSLGIRLAFRFPQRNVVTVTTNVPGPRQPLYALGRRLVEVFPYVPIATTLRFGVAVFTYCGQVTFGITGDRDSTADIDVLARGIEDSLAELSEAAQRKATAQRSLVGAGVVSG